MDKGQELKEGSVIPLDVECELRVEDGGIAFCRSHSRMRWLDQFEEDHVRKAYAAGFKAHADLCATHASIPECSLYDAEGRN